MFDPVIVDFVGFLCFSPLIVYDIFLLLKSDIFLRFCLDISN